MLKITQQTNFYPIIGMIWHTLICTYFRVASCRQYTTPYYPGLHPAYNSTNGSPFYDKQSDTTLYDVYDER